MAKSKVNYIKMGEAFAAYFRHAASGLTSGGSKEYSRPGDYPSKVKVMWNDYDADPLFRFLVDRIGEFGINGTRWDMEDKAQLPFWNEWARRVNGDGYIDILPGLDEVESWICKGLSLGAMAVLEWDKGNMSINGKVYQVPTNITTYPATAIELKNDNNVWGQTKAWVTKPGGNKVELQNTASKGAFVLKLNWSPADLMCSGKIIPQHAGSIQVENTLYPNPMFIAAHEDIETRLKLRELDRTTINDMINLIWYFKIGDKDNQPKNPVVDKDGKVTKKGTIAEIAEIVKDTDKSRSGGTRTFFMPYFVTLDKLAPDVTTLLNYEKYLPATLNLLSAFGILMASGGDSRLNFTDINTQSFEQKIEFIRQKHIKRFIEGVLCISIVRANKGKGLTEVPSLRFNTLNTKTKDFRDYILNLFDRGAMAARVACESANINYDAMITDLRKQVGEVGKNLSDAELFKLAAPIKFNQIVSKQAGDVTSATGGTNAV